MEQRDAEQRQREQDEVDGDSKHQHGVDHSKIEKPISSAPSARR
jgi:hypothetical protein